jgi:predicted alpha/beta-hydrolase family hydrolase
MLVRLARLLTASGLEAKRVTLPRGRPSLGLAAEVAALERHPADAYVGRSFGGRVCVRVPRAVRRVLLGFPVRPKGRQRPDDEEALLALRSPTLILQGANDELGPVRVLEGLCAQNPVLKLEVIEGAAHAYGRHERGVLERAAQWLAAPR